jgi:hypothetical protein
MQKHDVSKLKNIHAQPKTEHNEKQPPEKCIDLPDNKISFIERRGSHTRQKKNQNRQDFQTESQERQDNLILQEVNETSKSVIHTHTHTHTIHTHTHTHIHTPKKALGSVTQSHAT